VKLKRFEAAFKSCAATNSYRCGTVLQNDRFLQLPTAYIWKYFGKFLRYFWNQTFCAQIQARWGYVSVSL